MIVDPCYFVVVVSVGVGGECVCVVCMLPILFKRQGLVK